jgi:hypothetical protein
MFSTIVSRIFAITSIKMKWRVSLSSPLTSANTDFFNSGSRSICERLHLSAFHVIREVIVNSYERYLVKSYPSIPP